MIISGFGAMMKKTTLILSCEHAGFHIPDKWEHLFSTESREHSFAHYDIHAKELTETLALAFKCDYQLGQTSRQFVDLNKHNCLGKNLKTLPELEKQEIIESYYQAYHDSFTHLLTKYLSQNHQILHIAIHTFNPIADGKELGAAIGLLYNPSRHAEKEVVRIWNELLIKRTPYKTRLNYPRTGRGKNFPNCLRKQFNENDYLGIELECNDLLLSNSDTAQELKNALIETLQVLLEIL